jgi:hypothetical protein
MQAPASTCLATPPAPSVPSASRHRSEAGACPVATLALSTVCERLCGRIARACCGRRAVARSARPVPTSCIGTAWARRRQPAPHSHSGLRVRNRVIATLRPDTRRLLLWTDPTAQVGTPARGWRGQSPPCARPGPRAPRTQKGVFRSEPRRRGEHVSVDEASHTQPSPRDPSSRHSVVRPTGNFEGASAAAFLRHLQGLRWS